VLVVVGFAEIQFDDYSIDQPSSFSVLSTEEHGTLELLLAFTKTD
jgi:hypothetical protein